MIMVISSCKELAKANSDQINTAFCLQNPVFENYLHHNTFIPLNNIYIRTMPVFLGRQAFVLIMQKSPVIEFIKLKQDEIRQQISSELERAEARMIFFE